MSNRIPASFFFGFFENAKVRMEEHPKEGLKLVNDDEEGFPISLQQHRELLLEEQVLVLKEEVSRYVDSSASAAVSLSCVQDRLRELGRKEGTCHISFGENEEEEEKLRLEKVMEEMNESARLAFARAVLKSEVDWVHHREVQTGSKQLEDIYAHRTLRVQLPPAEEEGHPSNAIMDFCSLCIAAVKIPAVIHHLYHGTDIFKSTTTTTTITTGSRTAEEEETTVMMMHQRLGSLQNVYFCALGYHPQFGHSELKRFLHRYLMMSNHPSNDNNTDTALHKTLQSFITSMQLVQTNYTNQSVNNDGITRVVSVSHSEKIIHSSNNDASELVGGPPIRHSMHEEEQQKDHLEMAKKAASLQQSILSSIQHMSKEQRELELVKAKKVHDDFLSAAMKLPPGPERVNFLQSVDQNTQRLLIIHKLCAHPNAP